ncbi:LPXTG cell wall anchor domain-containing protein [Carnobacterium gallinarum]|uniref:LPXTG cell wall anchor domain-containing protein n=1 Tax=Carnobacterium gallinarum TaxID=2749 RepID=UPI001FE062DB|nr:LPXTG cell wall anchor domain-containing protein [Carnobacterium gallinarum]
MKNFKFLHSKRNLLFGLVVLSGLIIGLNSSISASASTMDSNVGIEFTGEVTVKKPDPPKVPDPPVIPGTPTPIPGGKLPQTGESQTDSLAAFVGIFIIGIGLTFMKAKPIRKGGEMNGC